LIPTQDHAPATSDDPVTIHDSHVILRETLLDPIDILVRDRIMKDELGPYWSESVFELIVQIGSINRCDDFKG
jgi:hypothetical protein